VSAAPGAGEGPLRVERWLAAPPERVYAYLTDAALWRRWQGTDAELEARPGRELRVFLGGGRDAGARGHFVELVPHARVSFTWEWVNPPPALAGLGPTLVEVELEPRDGGTLLRLAHSQLPPIGARCTPRAGRAT